jgi:NADPH-dependent glutamate synthase beta subunit-like oxidoreductase
MKSSALPHHVSTSGGAGLSFKVKIGAYSADTRQHGTFAQGKALAVKKESKASAHGRSAQEIITKEKIKRLFFS